VRSAQVILHDVDTSVTTSAGIKAASKCSTWVRMSRDAHRLHKPPEVALSVGMDVHGPASTEPSYFVRFGSGQRWHVIEAVNMGTLAMDLDKGLITVPDRVRLFMVAL